MTIKASGREKILLKAFQWVKDVSKRLSKQQVLVIITRNVPIGRLRVKMQIL